MSGFKTIKSEILNEEIIILLDTAYYEDAFRKKKVIYKEEEVNILGELELDDESLLSVHKIKKAFGGWIRKNGR